MQGYEIVHSSQIDGEFEGFNDEVLFQLMDGTCWVQDEYNYWYHYSYCPQVNILRGNGRLYIQVDGQNEIVPVRQIDSVIKSRISGEFKGWEGETSYELMNGQVWQQSHYKYKYKYAHNPEVLIYNPGGGHIMQVAGTSAKVRRVK
ncbi:hypothetical protein NQT74_18385 [Alteromonas stellipolaris]|uniref:hypothetical protein n=1 Tax=Alteromonas stellipolaris TaxID=233316 RepID=UPI0021177EA1|nr:hypothetical protein [Alteromonas stellipolaris]MCQ8850554.1 hypothetical protein [Alteromonas stellipolaris]